MPETALSPVQRRISSMVWVEWFLEVWKMSKASFPHALVSSLSGLVPWVSLHCLKLLKLNALTASSQPRVLICISNFKGSWYLKRERRSTTSRHFNRFFFCNNKTFLCWRSYVWVVLGMKRIDRICKGPEKCLPGSRKRKWNTNQPRTKCFRDGQANHLEYSRCYISMVKRD